MLLILKPTPMLTLVYLLNRAHDWKYDIPMSKFNQTKLKWIDYPIDGQEIKVDIASSKGDNNRGGRQGGGGGGYRGGRGGGNPRRLYVSGVNENCPNDVLNSEFSKFGEVEDLFITRKGFAFVTMGDDDGAAQAIR